MDWIDLAQTRDCCIDFVNTILQEMLGCCTTCGLPRRAQLHGVHLVSLFKGILVHPQKTSMVLTDWKAW
jgi:hypothetical protein